MLSHVLKRYIADVIHNSCSFSQEIHVATVSQVRPSPAYFCGLRVGDKIITYTSATKNLLDHFSLSGSCEMFIEYVKSAYSEKKHLLLALHRQTVV